LRRFSYARLIWGNDGTHGLAFGKHFMYLRSTILNGGSNCLQIIVILHDHQLGTDPRRRNIGTHEIIFTGAKDFLNIQIAISCGFGFVFYQLHFLTTPLISNGVAEISTAKN
jgi:hypothetical protein